MLLLNIPRSKKKGKFSIQSQLPLICRIQYNNQSFILYDTLTLKFPDRGDGPKDAGEMFVEKLKSSKGEDLPPVIVSISETRLRSKALACRHPDIGQLKV